ncbi:MAG: nucleotide exchange factor GrpE [Bacillota bacterium]
MLNTNGKSNGVDAAEQAQTEVAEGQPAEGELDRLRKELECVRQKAEEHWELFLRARADFDNYRKRIEAEADRRVAQAQAEIILKLLEVRDNLDRALGLPEDASVAALKKGVEMVAKQFDMVLEGVGLAPVQSVGCQFDPAVHEAVEVVADSGHREGTVIEEVRRGYTFKGQLLRAARVKVAGKRELEGAQ